MPVYDALSLYDRPTGNKKSSQSMNRPTKHCRVVRNNIHLYMYAAESHQILKSLITLICDIPFNFFASQITSICTIAPHCALTELNALYIMPSTRRQHKTASSGERTVIEYV